MDFFGIGTAIKGIMRIYFRSARQTGRTTSLVEGVKDGDRIIFTNSREAGRVEHLCKERGVSVECVVLPPDELGRVFELGTSRGRTIFDHSWLEQYYMDAIQRRLLHVDYLEKDLSGYGVAHRETRRKAKEISKWNV